MDDGVWGTIPFSTLCSEPPVTILASGSPRRAEILKNLGVKFTIVLSGFPENLVRGQGDGSQIDYVCRTCKAKGLNVYDQLLARNSLSQVKFIVAADTIVYEPITDTILEKPNSRSDAARMLSFLSGKEHVIYSAVSVIVIDKDDQSIEEILMDYDSTISRFEDIDMDFIERYTKHSDEPLDKAGACAEFGMLSVYVKEIRGSFYTLMGFPVSIFFKMINEYLKA